MESEEIKLEKDRIKIALHNTTWKNAEFKFRFANINLYVNDDLVITQYDIIEEGGRFFIECFDKNNIKIEVINATPNTLELNHNNQQMILGFSNFSES